jgi:putative ABC transport system permease protein
MRLMRLDARYALRSLLRSPAFAAMALASLGLGIGVNTAIFMVIDAVFLRPLPYPHAERIVAIRQGGANPKLAMFVDWRMHSDAFDAFGAYQQVQFTSTSSGTAEALDGISATAEATRLLALSTIAGRSLFKTDEQSGAERVALLSKRVADARFGNSATAIGRVVDLDGTPYTVVGVVDPSFRMPEFTATDVYTPLVPAVGATPAAESAARVIGILRLGESAARAATQLDLISRRSLGDTAIRPPAPVSAIPLRDLLGGAAPGSLWVIQLAVALIQVLVCVNLGNLLLARMQGRRHEVALRLALGAGRVDIVRQIAVEVGILAMLGAGAGLVLADMLLQASRFAITAYLPRWISLQFDWRVLVFVVGCTALTAAACAIAPAVLQTRVDPGDELRSGPGAGQARSLRAAQAGLVVVEVAFATALLTGSVALIRGFLDAQRRDLGYDPAPLLSAFVPLHGANYSDPSALSRYHAAAVNAIEAIPGITAASVQCLVILSSPGLARNSLLVDGRADAVPDVLAPHFGFAVSPHYFRTMGVRVLAGREFNEADVWNGENVVLVNEATRRRIWPEGGAVGQRIRLSVVDSARPWFTVVGVVGNIRRGPFEASSVTPDQPLLYVPYAQHPQRALLFTARSSVSPVAVVGNLRAALQGVDRDSPPTRVRLMTETLAETLGPIRFSALLVTVLGLFAIVLSLAGVYGTVSYAVTLRTREIGLRSALGAQRSAILSLIVGGAGRLVVAGLVLGCVGGGIGLRLLRSVMVGIRGDDALDLVTVAAMLFVCALAAAAVPALRATRIDPLSALRHE